MAKTVKDYTDEYYNSAKIGVDKQYEQRKKTDQQTISDIDATLTKSAQAAEDKYQQQIDAAPGTYHAQFAKNELNEALGRQRAEMKMANMGMTDSGLSETSQAALSVQRANANDNARRDMQSLVSGLETAISDVWAKKESTLADKTMSINKNTDDWYTSTLAQLSSDAQTAGATAYAAEQEVEAARIKAQQEAEANNKFVPFTYSGVDSANPNNNLYYRDGKSYSYAIGVNPYTGTTNPDIKNGAFSNGYQPDNVGGSKLYKSGDTDVVNGVTQNVWYTAKRNGRRAEDVTYTYYIWDGTQNRYLEYDYYA